MNYKEFFKNKKITIMGLGLLGRGISYTKFLAECGADLIVTDLKSKEDLASSLKQLSKFKNITYRLGEHNSEDFKGRDMIIKSAGVPIDSIYIKEAKKNKIPVYMDVSLFIKLASKIKVVGVTGTRGKTMTTMLIYEILSKSIKDRQVFLGGNIRGVATLPFLKKVKEGDILVCELDSWQLQGFGEDKISPNISVFTSFMEDHMNYYKNSMQEYFSDKANIFKYQREDDFLIINPNLNKLINKDSTKAKLIRGNIKEVENFKFVVPGEHQKMNLALAYEVAKLLGIKDSEIKKVVKDFKGIEGRLEFLREYKGIKIYNDNNATTPSATIAGINSFPNKNIILITGGADKKIDLKEFVKVINKKVKYLSLIPGTGTDVLLKEKIKVEKNEGKNLKEVVYNAIAKAKKGDIVLFSPAFASFGMFKNEYDRNDKFVKIIKGLK